MRARHAWLAAAAVAAVAPLVLVDDALQARALALTLVYLVLALSEIVPAVVPPLLLLAAVPVALGPLDDRFEPAAVIAWPAEPVMALFFGGFVLALVAQRHGLATRGAAGVVRLARGRRRALVALVLAFGAVASMWLSAVAAATVLVAALRPLLATTPRDDGFRRAVLLAAGVGASLGGLATPIGAGPNALAIAAVAPEHRISFLTWMAFGVPLAALLLAGAFALIVGLHRVQGAWTAGVPTDAGAGRPRLAGLLFGAAVAAWLTEPLHGVPAPIVAMLAAAAAFASGLLDRDDLGRLDWSTLALVAGGLSLSRLLETSGLVRAIAGAADWAQLSPVVWLGALVLVAALLSALMSNTATAALLLPIAAAVDPAPSTAVLIAVATSLGIPFVISTPANMIVHGEGVTGRDLLRVGLPLMIAGCLLVTLTGRVALRVFGVP